MNKNKWKKLWEDAKEKLQFLRLAEDADLEDPLEVEERSLSSGNASEIDLPEGDLKQKLERNRIRRLRRRISILVLAVLVIGGFVLYNKLYTFQDYTIVESIENKVAGGTRYESAGKIIYRYNSDGVSCVTRNNEVKWSITYNMQAPIADICGSTLVIAEQQGSQIYVVNEEGLVGNFETLLPVKKVRVSNQGVVAAVLEEDDVTWINLYRPDGTAIVDDKTTVSESGYPLDVDISADGKKIVVSYLGIDQGVMKSDVVFYDFSRDELAGKNYIVSSETFAEKVVPEVYFAGNATAAAVMDTGFAVFKGSKTLELSTEVTFEEEIISTFHDDERIGFLFKSTEEEYQYNMQIYNYRGKRKASHEINADFDKIKIQNGQILMFSDKTCQVFTLSGRERFSSAYEKEIQDVFYFSEFRKYLIITSDSFDRIRIS